MKKIKSILVVVLVLIVGFFTYIKDTNVKTSSDEYIEYHFRNEKYLEDHYQKHGIEMGFSSASEYEKAASDFINNEDCLYKNEKEDNDGVYYLESTNEFAILSSDGYIRTYFMPDDGIDYFNRQ